VNRPRVEPRRDFPELHSPDAPPNNLPDELTSFIGRSAELARVRELLGEARLLTLVGAGGCGKTRLALQAAAGAVERFPDGAWWVELAALEDAALLATTVTSALRLHERPDQAPLEVLCQHLRDRRALLVLDNCEHLLVPCSTLVDVLLRSCRGLVILATSREALRVPGELPYAVPSLKLPAETGSVRAVTQSEAGRLFIDRAVQVRESFAVGEDSAPAVAAICRRLDGIPLAIELAAARARMLPPGRIAKELDDRFRLLTGGGRTVAPRHQTLRASMDWSHELCSDQERVLFRRLSVWTGGWTLDGAEVVSSDETLDRRAILELLAGLVDKSLVDIDEREGELRYRMLETIRHYAAERLAAAGEVDAMRARHLAWCVELAEQAEPELVRHESAAWLRRLELEAPNLRAALDWAVARDGDAALRLAATLTFFWLNQGQLEEGTAALARVLESAPEPSAGRARVLWGLAYLNVYRGKFDACLSYAERALADADAAGERSAMARALAAQGFVLSLTDHLQGRAPLQRSLELAREAGDDWCAADATRMLAASYMRQSEHDLARPIFEESYALARALGYQPHVAWYFTARATGELEHGRVAAARALAEQGVAISNDIGEPVTLGRATALLAECDVLQGLPGEGRARAETCLELVRSTGVRSAEAWLEGTLALADVAEGLPDAARARIEALFPLIEAAPAYDVVARARRTLAVAMLLSGDLDGAAKDAHRLLSHAERGRNEHIEAMARHLLGRVAIARAGVMEAQGHLHEALAIAARRDFRVQTFDTLESLAQVAVLTDSLAEAARLLGAVRGGREQLGTVRWPPEHEAWAEIEEQVRSALGHDSFAAAWAQGTALSVDEAVEYVSRARGERKRPSRGWESLTPTELQIVRHVVAGLTNPQIGERMFISRSTVKAHLSHIFAKLGTASRSELAAEGTRRGLGAPGAGDAATP
jgi:predicted ATPase/DNA-binding CsgD family transcriptional regulator